MARPVTFQADMEDDPLAAILGAQSAVEAAMAAAQAAIAAVQVSATAATAADDLVSSWMTEVAETEAVAEAVSDPTMDTEAAAAAVEVSQAAFDEADASVDAAVAEAQAAMAVSSAVEDALAAPAEAAAAGCAGVIHGTPDPVGDLPAWILLLGIFHLLRRRARA